MAHRFRIVVEVELNREQGKFASRDDLVQGLIDEIEGADPGGLYGMGDDGSSDYTVDSFEVSEAPEPLTAKRIAQILAQHGVDAKAAKAAAAQLVRAAQ